MADALAVPEKASYEDLELKLKKDQRAELDRVISQLEDFVSVPKKQDLELEVSSTFVRLLVEKLLERSYPTLYLEPSVSGSPFRDKLSLSFRKVTSQDKKDIKQELMLSLVGFTAVFEQIWKRPIKVIGHNSFFDLLYLYNNFVGELPVSYTKFKEDVNTGFPRYYDTKLVCKGFDCFDNGSSLEELQRVILSERWTKRGPL